MAGIIENAAQPQQGAAPEALTSENVRSQMQVPPELQSAYDKVVANGMKMMFDPSTRDQTAAFMQGEGPASKKLADGVASVVMLMFRESNQTMPPQVIIPAGIELLVHAAEVANASGMPVSNDDVAEAMADFMSTVLKAFGVDPENMQGMVTPMTGGAETAPQQEMPA